MKPKRCLQFPTGNGCTNEPGPRNPYWCDECDDRRIDHITARFEEIDERFEEANGGAVGRPVLDDRGVVRAGAHGRRG